MLKHLARNWITENENDMKRLEELIQKTFEYLKQDFNTDYDELIRVNGLCIKDINLFDYDEVFIYYIDEGIGECGFSYEKGLTHVLNDFIISILFELIGINKDDRDYDNDFFYFYRDMKDVMENIMKNLNYCLKEYIL